MTTKVLENIPANQIDHGTYTMNKYIGKPVSSATDAVAEAWASIDGKLTPYFEEREAKKITHGHYYGYQSDAQELIKRIEVRGWKLVKK